MKPSGPGAEWGCLSLRADMIWDACMGSASVSVICWGREGMWLVKGVV